ncbi:MAG: hypothetical protein ACI4U3_09745 [Traorella sp.]
MDPLLLVLFTVIFILVVNLLKKLLTNHYFRILSNSMLESEQVFNSKIDSLPVKLLFRPFNREFIRLNYYMIHHDEKAVANQANFVENKMRLSKKELRMVLFTTFEFFISCEHKTKVKEYQNKLLKYLDENEPHSSLKDEINMSVSVFIDHDINQLPYITEKIEKSNDKEKIDWYIRRAHLFEFCGRIEEAINDLNACKKLCKDDNEKLIQIEDLLSLYANQ